MVRADEAQTVRLIFERYLALDSLTALQRDLRERGIVTRRRTLTSGRIIGGITLSNGPLAHILRNRVYVGELNHRGASYPAEMPRSSCRPCSMRFRKSLRPIATEPA